MVAKEITGCYGKILAAMAISMSLTGVNSGCLQLDMNAYSKYVKNL